MSEYENIPLRDVFEMTVINFLNDLSYLKEQDAHERLMVKNARDSEQ